MEQEIVIKKVTIDNELKVSLFVEFVARDELHKQNVFDLIRMQGDVVYATFTPAQIPLSIQTDKNG